MTLRFFQCGVLVALCSLAACRSAPSQRPADQPAARADARRPAAAAPPETRTAAEVALDVRADDADGYASLLRALHLGNQRAAILSSPVNTPRVALLRCQVLAEDRRYGAFLEACAQVVALAPASPEAEVALAVMDQARGQHPDYAARLAGAAQTAVDGCVASGAPHCASLTAYALARAMAVAGGRGDAAGFAALAARSGLVTAWSVAGPVASAEVDAFRALAGVARQGLPTQPSSAAIPRALFHQVVRKAPDGLLMPARYAPNGLWSAQSAIHVARPTRALLTVRSSASVRVYLSGELVLTQDRWARNLPSETREGVVLPPGWHRLVLEAAADSGDVVEVRLVGENGLSPLDNVAPALPEGAAWSSHVTAMPAPATAADAWATRAQKDGWDVEALLAWALLLQSRGDQAQAHGVLEEAARRFPRSARVHTQAALAAEDHRGLSEATRRALVQKHLETALAHQKDNLVARYRLAVALQQRRPEDALLALRALAADRPDYPHVHRSIFEVLRGLDWKADARVALEDALRAGGVDGVAGPGAAFLRNEGDAWRASQLEELTLQREDSPWSAERADHLADALDLAGALREWSRIVATHPAHPRHAERVAMARRTADARTHRLALEAHRDVFPWDAQVWAEQCAVLRAQEEARPARRCVEDLLAEHPSNASALRLLAPLDGQPLDADVESPDVRELMLTVEKELAAGAPWVAGHSTVVALDLGHRVFHADGGSHFVQHRLIRVGTRESADALGEITLGNNEEKRILRVWQPDGTVVEPETGQGKAAVSLSGLQEGDYLELRTVSLGDDPPADGTAADAFYLDGAHPVLHAQYSVSVPADLASQLEVSAAAVVPVPHVVQEGPRRTQRWTLQRVPAVPPEAFAPPAMEYRAVVTAVLRGDAALDARRSARGMAGSTRPSAGLEAAAASIRAEQKTPSARLAAALTLVRTRIQPDSRPWAADDAWEERRGSSLSVLKTLLRLMNIPARVVLGKTLFAAHVDARIPGTHDVVILVVPTESGERHLIQLGTTLLEEPLPPFLEPTALEADADEVALLGKPHELPQPNDSAWEQNVSVDLTLDANGDALGTVRVVVAGVSAHALRQQVGEATAQQLQQWLAQQLVQQFPGAELDNVETSSVEARAGPFTITMAFRVRGLFRAAGAGGRVWDGFLERPMSRALVGGMAVDEYLRVGLRSLPLLTARPLRERLRARVRLPPGTTATALPRTFAASGTGWKLQQSAEVKDGALLLERIHRVEAVRVLPSEYAAWRAGVESAITQGRNRLELRPAR